MGHVVVDLSPRAESAAADARSLAAELAERGVPGFSAVRREERLVLDVDGPVTEQVLDAARKAASLLVDQVSWIVADVREDTDAFDWDDDANPESWGAEAPIPEGAGRHEGRVRATPVQFDADGLAEGVGSYDED